MPQASHTPNVSVDIVLSAAPQQGRGRLPMGIFLMSLNSLDGDRSRRYSNVTDAAADVDDGFLSSTAYDAVATMLSQNPSPDEVMIGNIDDSVAVAAVKAARAFGPLAGDFDTTIEATVAGAAGNSIEVVLLGDNVAGVTIEVLMSGLLVIIHFQAGVSTITNVETAIAALAGANDVIGVQTGGTGATVLDAGDAIEAMLAGGSDAVLTEDYADALDAIRAEDDGFYGVFIGSRVLADIEETSEAIEALAGGSVPFRCIFAAQNAAANWLAGTVPGALTGWTTRERSRVCYHDAGGQYMDAATLANRLAFSLDNASVPWHLYEIAGVDEYTAEITQAERTAALGVYADVLGPFGAASTVVDPGKNGKGRPIKEIVTSDWFHDGLQADIADMVLSRANAGEAVTIDAKGQALVLAVIDARIQIGRSIGHFTGPYTSRALTITAGDIAAGQMRFQVALQLATGARLFDIFANLSRDPVAV